MDIKNAKILIVEDEPQINRLVEMVLISDGFYNIKKAFDGKEAIDMLKKEKPDLVILDVMLPEIDGFEVCKYIKSNTYLNKIQVIMLTAKKMEEDILTGFECGAVDYISKPFNNKILLARVKAHLNNIDFNEISFQDVKIDDLKKNVIINDKQINLTKYEYEILKFMLTSPGVVYSRSQILNHLRGYDSFNVSERAIDVQILNLRRKLGQFGNNIVTVRGIGYKLEDILDEKKR